MSEIKISKKHGFNPTIPICFWCGEEKNEIILLGELPEDKEAPPAMVVDYEPCDKCKEGMKTGITFMEAKSEPITQDQPPMQKDVYPTGLWCVIKEEAVKKMPFPPDMLQQTLEKRKIFVDSETWDALGLPRKNIDNR